MGRNCHLIQAEQLTPPFVRQILTQAERFEKLLAKGERNFKELEGVIVCSNYYEESTRTRFSLESAALRLGAHVIMTENAAKFSSAAKGEDLDDSITVIGGGANNAYLSLADIIILRHPETGAAKIAAACSGVPVINAGDGWGHHPLQALTDLYAFKKTLGRLHSFVITFCGDLKNSRIIGDVVFLLSRCPRVEMIFVSPKGLEIREELRYFLHRRRVKFTEEDDIKKVVGRSDIVYFVRIQKNRLKGLGGKILLWHYKRKRDNYALTEEIYKMSAKKGTFFFHPMPVDKKEKEIRPEVKKLRRMMMYKQANYKLVIGMAVLVEMWKRYRRYRRI